MKSSCDCFKKLNPVGFFFFLFFYFSLFLVLSAMLCCTQYSFSFLKKGKKRNPLRWKINSKHDLNISTKTSAKQWTKQKSRCIHFQHYLQGYVYSIKRDVFSTLSIYNKIMTPKILKTSSNQNRLGTGTVSPGPHGRGRKLEENP